MVDLYETFKKLVTMPNNYQTAEKLCSSRVTDGTPELEKACKIHKDSQLRTKEEEFYNWTDVHSLVVVFSNNTESSLETNGINL